jgi:putative ABC transport system ATP-binding protein
MIKVRDLKKTYANGDIETKVLKGIDFDVAEGEFVAIMGKSGAGKSTFMYQVGLLDKPTSGSIQIKNIDVLALSEREGTDFRLENLGYVFQDYALVPELSALENVMLPLMMKGFDSDICREKGLESLKKVEMDHRTLNRPNQLSGGEQQRVSIARAVAGKPDILFADEPTANLDSFSSQNVIDILADLNKKGQTIVMVTHEKEYTSYCDRIVHLEDGRIVREEKLK